MISRKWQYIGSIVAILFFSQTAFGQITTTGSGNWNSATPDAPWPGGTVPGAAEDVTIDASHTVTLDVNTASLTSLSINATGTLSTTSTFTVNATTITVDGTYTNGSTGSITVTTMNVNSGATYEHAINGGTIPTATWAATSNCNITGVTTTVPTGFAQTFGNLTWNSAGQTINAYLQADITVQGDFTISGTGAFDPTNNALRMSNTGASHTINVTGDLIVSNTSTFKMNNSTGSCFMNVVGDFNLNSGNYTIVTGNANSTLSVTGNVNILGGTLQMHEDASATTATLNVTGDLTHSGGTITEGGGGNGHIVFNNAGIQTFTDGGTISFIIDFTVSIGSTLQMAATGTTITGAGTFTLASGATLGVTSVDGITTAGATGNIQTGTRTFTSGANYIYNGGIGQAVGNGLTQNTPADLEINNPGFTVSLGALTGITGDVIITSGTLDANGQNISLAGDWTNNGGTFTPGAGTVTFNGTGAQAINGTTATQTFNDLTINIVGGALSVGGSTTTLNVANFTQTLGDFTGRISRIRRVCNSGRT